MGRVALDRMVRVLQPVPSNHQSSHFGCLNIVAAIELALSFSRKVVNDGGETDQGPSCSVSLSSFGNPRMKSMISSRFRF